MGKRIRDLKGDKENADQGSSVCIFHLGTGLLNQGPFRNSCNLKIHMDVNLLTVQFIVFKMNFVRKKIRQASGWLNFLPFIDYTEFKELRIWLR